MDMSPRCAITKAATIVGTREKLPAGSAPRQNPSAMTPLSFKRLAKVLIRTGTGVIWGCVLLLAAGCHRATPPAPALTIEQVPQAIEQAFQLAAPEARENAGHIATVLRSNQDTEAFAELQTLSARPELSPEQRLAAGRSMTTLLERLRTAAAKGDKKAEDALDNYRATK